MYDFNDLVKLIKKAAIEAVNASKPTALVYGKVISSDPLKIKVDQKMILSKPQLILTRNVTDYKVDMSFDHITENTSGGTGEGKYDLHNHAYKGKKTFKIHNSLISGEEVVMIQVQGGQKYLILDRVVNL